jgi:diaminopimelate epimerase
MIKTEGAGNDFLVASGDWGRRLSDDSALVVRLCNRRTGIGADGVLAIEAESRRSIRIVHRNADGSRSAFCANGTRCAARVAVERLECEPTLTVRTDWADIPAVVHGELVTLELPPPTPPREIELVTEAGRLAGWLLSVGVPHLVISVDALADIDMVTVAAPLRQHPELGENGANIHLVEATDRGSLAIRSFERGVPDEVLCCGSGVVAAALMRLARSGDRAVTVIPRSGDALEVAALGSPPMSSSRLTGPARLVALIEPFD